MCKIRVGDTVILKRGKDKNKTGSVTSIKHCGDNSYVTISGLAIYKKAKKAKNPEEDSGFVYNERMINTSHVAFLDTETGRPTKLGYRINSEGKKIRFKKIDSKEI